MTPKETRELMAAMRQQFDSVLAKAEFLKLKKSELYPGSEISFFGLLQAREDFITERSILCGHAEMLRDELRSNGVVLTANDKRLLQEIHNFSQSWADWY